MCFSQCLFNYLIFLYYFFLYYSLYLNSYQIDYYHPLLLLLFSPPHLPQITTFLGPSLNRLVPVRYTLKVVTQPRV